MRVTSGSVSSASGAGEVVLIAADPVVVAVDTGGTSIADNLVLSASSRAINTTVPDWAFLVDGQTNQLELAPGTYEVITELGATAAGYTFTGETLLGVPVGLSGGTQPFLSPTGPAQALNGLDPGSVVFRKIVSIPESLTKRKLKFSVTLTAPLTPDYPEGTTINITGITIVKIA